MDVHEELKSIPRWVLTHVLVIREKDERLVGSETNYPLRQK